MRKPCLVFAFALTLALPAWSVEAPPVVPKAADTAVAAPAPVDTGATAASNPDSAKSMPAAEPAALPSVAAVSPSAPAPSSRALFPDPMLVAKEYVFGVLGQTVAGALGFFIGSAIETAISGEEDAHKGTLSFKGLRYDNYYGAFWGGSLGGLMGASLTVYFTGQTDEEDGGYFWTLVGTGLAGAGALYAAHLMGVNDDVDWKPFLPLLAIPSAGGALAFNISRWFSDRKRESVMGPGAGLRLHPPRLALGAWQDGGGFHLKALNLSF